MQEYEAADGLPDPWEGNHSIDYWVWHGDRLLPATRDELAQISEDERTREALYRLKQMKRSAVWIRLVRSFGTLWFRTWLQTIRHSIHMREAASKR